MGQGGTASQICLALPAAGALPLRLKTLRFSTPPPLASGIDHSDDLWRHPFRMLQLLLLSEAQPFSSADGAAALRVAASASLRCSDSSLTMKPSPTCKGSQGAESSSLQMQEEASS